MQLYQVDAFTNRPFAGNPAAVCLLDGAAPDEAWMQSVAAEMNLAETAFVEPRGAGHFGLRWFTPLVEVALCGHATLATAHVLWTEVGATAAALRFETASGELVASRAGDAIELDFPVDPVTPVAPQDVPPRLHEALGTGAGAGVVDVGRARFDYLVQLCGAAEVAALEPDIGALREVDTRGLIVTAAGDEASDFVSRFFAPRVGIDEDPATGSAHCALAPYWSERLGRVEMVGHQLSRRGATIGVRLEGGRVILRGQAVTVMRGELT